MSMLIFLGFGFVGLGMATAQAAPPSAFDMFKPSSFFGAEMSPSGRYLATVRSKLEKVCLDKYGQTAAAKKQNCKEEKKSYRAIYYVMIADLEGGEEPTILPLGQDQYVSWLEWANDDRLLIKVKRRTTINDTGKRFSIGGSIILSIKRDGSGVVQMFGESRRVKKDNFYLSNVNNFLRQDPDHIIMAARKSGDLDLFKVDVNTGIEERIAIGRRFTFRWYTDKEGKPILRFDYNAGYTKVFIYSWSDEKQDWEKIQTVRLKRRDGEEVYSFDPVATTDVEHQIYVISDEDDDAHRSVKIFDIKENKYVETVFEHPKYDVGGVFTNISTGDYAGVWYYGDRLQYELVDQSLQKHIDALNTYFDNEENVDIVGFNRRGTQAVVFASGPTNPGAYYRYDFEKHKIDLLFNIKPNLADIQLGKMEILDVPMRDGTIIRAYLTHPAGGPNPDAPLIVMPHGGPEARDYYDYDSWVQYLSTRGYQVYQMNFRGSDGYGRDFAKAGYRQWGGLMQDDVTDAVRYLFEQNRARPDQACIFGYSYGGYVALMGAIKTPNLFQCVIAGGAVTDLVYDLTDTRRDYGRKSETFDYWTDSIGDLKTEREKLKNISPVNNADRIQVPVFLFHGSLDSVVPFEEAKRMEKALKKTKRNYQFVTLKGEGHSGWDLEEQMMLWQKIDDFLGIYLPAN